MFMLFFPLNYIRASETGSLHVKMKNQSIFPYKLTSIRNITFDNSGNMLIHTDTGISFMEIAGIQNLLFIPEDELDVPTIREKRNDLLLFPNPVVNELFVSLENPQQNNVTVQLIDMNGRILQSLRFPDSHEIKLDVSYLSGGMYLCRVLTDNGNFSQKFLK
jgi:hypothetical protein